MEIEIIWRKSAVIGFLKALKWIAKDSVLQAENVETSINHEIEILKLNPEKYPPDKFKINNDGTYRAFELKGQRISYRFLKNEIHILRIRHIKKNPIGY